MPTSDDPNKRGSTDRPGEPGDPRQTGDQGSADFGSFVSSSVRSSFRQLKREAERANPKSAEPIAPSSRRRDRSRRRDDAPETAVPSGPVGRKWRDALGTSPRPVETTEEFGDEPETPDQGPPFNPGDWFRQTFFDENGPTRKFLALIGAIIIIVTIVIYLVLQGGGDGNGVDTDDITPTATTNVISPGRTSTPEADDDATPTPRTALERTPQATATSGVEVGGDNQRDDD